MTAPGRLIVIPVTPILLRYQRLRKAEGGHANRLSEARHFDRYPEELAAEFAASVSHFASYGNRDSDFSDRIDDGGVENADRPADRVIRKLATAGTIKPIDGASRARAAITEAPEIRDVPATETQFEYVSRETLLQQTRSPARWENGKPNRGGVRPDVLLVATKTPRTAIAGELKIADDMDSFFALLQALTCAAHMATPSQYARMRNAASLAKGGLPAVDGWPRVDVYVLFGGAATATYQDELTQLTLRLAPRLLQFDAVSRSVRRIVGIDLGVDAATPGAPLDPRVRFAFEKESFQPY